jgi:hypothetical protein
MQKNVHAVLKQVELYKWSLLVRLLLYELNVHRKMFPNMW